MRLTRMELDLKKRRTMFALSSPSIFHGAIESSFQGERSRNLWRIDQLHGKTYLLILSEEEPDLTKARDDLGVDGQPWESKDYAPLLERIADNSVWRFRLCANPTYSEAQEGKRGKVHAHRTPEHQIQWLIRQGEKHGFRMAEGSASVVESRWYHFSKGNTAKNDVSLLGVTFEGTLCVTDSETFRKALKEGIGREKAYGMGLLTIVRGG